MFVTGIIRIFRSNCPRGVQNKIALEAAILCSNSEVHFSEIVCERNCLGKMVVEENPSRNVVVVEENNRNVAVVWWYWWRKTIEMWWWSGDGGGGKQWKCGGSGGGGKL